MAISMMDYFNYKTPERILRILKLMELRTVNLEDLFEIARIEAQRKHRELFIERKFEETCKIIENSVVEDLKYLKDKLNITLNENDILV